MTGTAVYTPHGPALANTPNIVRNNIMAYAQTGMLGVNDPYQNTTAPFNPTLAFEFTNNLIYFDRAYVGNATQTNPSFTVISNCTYTGSSSPADFGNLEMLDWNIYWRTDERFATDANGFHVQVTPGPKDGKSYPCVHPDSTNYGDFDWFTFSGWQTATSQDRHSHVRDPHFVNPTYPYDDYRLRFGPPISGFIPFDPDDAGRTRPFSLFQPPAVARTFTTQTLNPATDF